MAETTHSLRVGIVTAWNDHPRGGDIFDRRRVHTLEGSEELTAHFHHVKRLQTGAPVLILLEQPRPFSQAAAVG
jgi:hypothetical protein